MGQGEIASGQITFQNLSISQSLHNMQYISQSITFPVVALLIVSQISYSTDWIILWSNYQHVG